MSEVTINIEKFRQDVWQNVHTCMPKDAVFSCDQVLSKYVFDYVLQSTERRDVIDKMKRDISYSIGEAIAPKMEFREINDEEFIKLKTKVIVFNMTEFNKFIDDITLRIVGLVAEKAEVN